MLRFRAHTESDILVILDERSVKVVLYQMLGGPVKYVTGLFLINSSPAK